MIGKSKVSRLFYSEYSSRYRLDEECDNMAREGLRTLVVARKRLSDEMYEEFRVR